MRKAGQSKTYLLFLVLLIGITAPLIAAGILRSKAVGEGLEFWIEFPSKQFLAWGSVPGYMHLSNTLATPHRFSEMKSRYYDTSIGDFMVELPDGTPVEGFVTLLERRASSLGSKGLFIEPHTHLASMGYLDRTFDLTNPGIYKVSGLLRIISSNWNGEFPLEWVELRSPPVEIEILPSTNARPVRPRVDLSPQPIMPSEIQSPTERTVPVKTPVPSIQQPSAATSPEPSVSPEHQRNWRFGLLAILPVLLAVGWIIWRRARS